MARGELVREDSDRNGSFFSRVTARLAALAFWVDSSRSVTGKITLVVLITTGIALLLAGTTLLVTDLRTSRSTWAENLATEASILALATAPALSFDDRTTASRNLHALQARHSIQAAVLYSPDGTLYASYVREDEPDVPVHVPALDSSPLIEAERIELTRPIVQNGEILGTLYMRAHYDMTHRVLAYAGILALVMMLSLVAAVFATAWLRRAITRPMESIARVAHEIVGRSDYSLRAAKTSADEVGVVVDAFNRMLDEVQFRTTALENSNEALRKEAKVRLAVEQALGESEKLYRAIGESIEYGVWVCDAAGRNTYASDSFLKLAGITQEQCSSFGWAELVHPEDREATMHAWQECVRTGNNWYREHRLRGTDGLYHDILAQGVAIRDEKGRISRWAGINLDISRLKSTEQALREADRRKDEFLATLAHELRNPLAPIRNAVRVLEMSSADELQRRWGREVISRQVHHMALLLDDLLDVSRITRGQLELRKDYVDLQSVVEVALETARPLVEAKRHSISVRMPFESVTLEADPLRLSQVLGNLLTNAAKYTDSGGQIGLTAALLPSGLQLSVKDNGIGLSPEVIPELFAMFSQVSSAIDRAEGGLGIGLALVKGLVALHGGTVEARSEGLGRGSEFLVHLPHRLVGSRPRRTDEAGAQPEVAPARGKLLIADDNRDAAETLAAVLRYAGYTVFTAFSGYEALEVARREHPQAVLTDIGMPGMTGYEVARRIRLEAWGRHALLVALTGWGHEDHKEDALAAGFNEHLTKPVDPVQVEQLLARMLASSSSAGHDDERRGSSVPSAS